MKAEREMMNTFPMDGIPEQSSTMCIPKGRDIIAAREMIETFPRDGIPGKKSYHRDLPEGWRVKPKKPVKQMNGVTYAASEDSDIHEESEEKIENVDELKDRFTETVYQEGNTDVDPYNAVVDTGCPMTGFHGCIYIFKRQT